MKEPHFFVFGLYIIHSGIHDKDTYVYGLLNFSSVYNVCYILSVTSTFLEYVSKHITKKWIQYTIMKYEVKLKLSYYF